MKAKLMILAASTLLLPACAKTADRRIVDPATTLARPNEMHDSYLKAHMRDGSLYVITGWKVDDGARSIGGTGTRYDVNREVMATGALGLSMDSVALFETNDVTVSASMIPLTILSVASAGLTVLCIANPKACFGSCPTFYASDASDEILAEGFSASIAPSLEDTDLDALPSLRPEGGTATLVMRNEALETHVVRWADLIVVPRRPGERVYAHLDGHFVSGHPVGGPARCAAGGEDCSAALSRRDGIERWSPADSTDLATRETIELEFDRPVLSHGSELGVLVVSRQSLLPTYVLYQGLAFMGSRATEWLAAFERQPEAARGRALALTDLMGGIELEYAAGPETWESAGRLLETGPLASDARILPVRVPAEGPIRVRLHLTRGMWRIDHVALVAHWPAPQPTRLGPSRVLRGGQEHPVALERLRDRALQLSTLPGDAYTIVYELPLPDADYGFFLESRGYYLEWMRDEWVAEENPVRAAQLFLDPAGALQVMAPEFKRAEPEMERVFWSSKYVPQR